MGVAIRIRPSKVALLALVLEERRLWAVANHDRKLYSASRDVIDRDALRYLFTVHADDEGADPAGLACADGPEIRYAKQAGITREWRFDIALPSFKIAFEYEGGAGVVAEVKGKKKRSRHSTITGFAEDCTKYGVAQVLGWHVYRIPPKLFEDGTASLLVRNAIATAMRAHFYWAAAPEFVEEYNAHHARLKALRKARKLRRADGFGR